MTPFSAVVLLVSQSDVSEASGQNTSRAGRLLKSLLRQQGGVYLDCGCYFWGDIATPALGRCQGMLCLLGGFDLDPTGVLQGGAIYSATRSAPLVDRKSPGFHLLDLMT